MGVTQASKNKGTKYGPSDLYVPKEENPAKVHSVPEGSERKRRKFFIGPAKGPGRGRKKFKVRS